MKWGVAGYGEVVRRRVLPALEELGQEVACLWGRDAQRLHAVGGHRGIPHLTTDFTELLERADAVYVATPVAAHVPLAADALRAGRHVLVEKPLCGALHPGADPLPPREPAQCAGVAYYRRLAPAVRRLRALLSGRRVHRAELRMRTAFAPAPRDPKRWRTELPLSGGGVLADAGSHRIDLLCWLLGEPAAVDCRVGARFPRGAERRARLRLGWRCGARAELDCAWAPGTPRDVLRVACEGGELRIDPLDSGHLTGRLDGAELDERLPPAPNPHQPLLEDFARCAALGGTPACPVAEAVTVDRVLARAYASASTTKEAQVP